MVNMCQKGGVQSKVLLTVTVESDFLIVRSGLSTSVCCCLDVSCLLTVWFVGPVARYCRFLCLGAGCWFVCLGGLWFVCLAGLWCLCPAIRWRGMPVVGLLCRYVTIEINCCVLNDGLR